MDAYPNAANTSHEAASTVQLYLRYAKRTLKYPGTIVLIAALIFGVALAKHFLSKKLYESSTVVLIQDQKISEEYVKAVVDNSPKRYINVLSQSVLSRSRLENIILDMDLYADKRGSLTMDDVVDHMRANTRVNVYGKESFKVTYLGEDPKTAQAVTARLAGIFISENVSKRTQDAEENMLFMDQQAREKKAKLTEIEEQLRVYKEENLGVLPSQQVEINQEKINLTARNESISEDIRNARSRLFIAQGSMREVVVRTGGKGAAKKTPKRKPDPRRQQLAQMQRELSQLKLQYTNQHPDVLRLQREISRLKSQIPPEPAVVVEAPKKGSKPTVKRVMDPKASAQVNAVRQEIAELEQEREKINNKIAELDKRQAQLPRVDLGLDKIERERQAVQENYTNLLNRMEEAERAFKLEKQNQGQQFKILDPANLPTRAAGLGLLKLGVAGLGLGLLFGFGGALVRVILDPHIYDPEDLQRYVDVEILAVIPRIPASKALRAPEA